MAVSQIRIERLKNLVTSAATEGNPSPESEKEYSEIRMELLAAPELQNQITGFIRACSNLKEVRRDMQGMFPKWAERSEHIRQELAPLLSGTIVRDPFQEVVAATDLAKLITLPQDIQNKGREGADCFIFLFCIENSIREFIVQVAAKEVVNQPKHVRQKIDSRKASEATRKYLPVRGNSDVYYCDFIELADIVKLNWVVFNKYFPGKTEHWFTSMMEELYAVRLLISHNSAVGEKELRQLDVFYNVIMSYLKIE